MDNLPLLSIVLLAPLVGTLLNCFISKQSHYAVRVVSIISILVSFLLTIYLFVNYDTTAGGFQFTENIPWITDLGVSYSVGVDGISLPLLLLSNLVGLAAAFCSWNVPRPKEFFMLLLLLITGVNGTFVATDLFIFLLCYEVVVIPLFILITVWGSTKRVTKEYAGAKLTMFLLMGSAFMLVGVIALYLGAYPAGMRTFSMEALSKAHAAGAFSANFEIFAFLLLLISFGSLLSMCPFHTWSPDGHAGAPTAVSMIHAGLLKKIGVYGLIRLGLLILPVGAKFWSPLLAALAIFSVIYAAFIALAQKDMKYMIGYSSVSHMGYILLGYATLNTVGLNGAVANMVAHGAMSALFFAATGYVYEKTHLRGIDELKGLAHQMPRVAVAFMLAGMASLGLPGLISFVPEFMIFVGAFTSYSWLAVVAISSVVFTAVYVLRVLAKILFGPREAMFDKYPDASGVGIVPLIILGIALVGFGIMPQLLLDVISSTVEPLEPLLTELNNYPTVLGGMSK